MTKFENGDNVKLVVTKETEYATYKPGWRCRVLLVLVDSNNHDEIIYLVDAEPVSDSREEYDLFRATGKEIIAY